MPRQKSIHVDSAHALARRLREARERKGLSQRELAFPGCTPAYVSRIERGERVPSLQILRELGRRLGVSADYLARGEPEAGGDDLADAELALRFEEFELAEHLFAEALTRATSNLERGRAQGGLGQVAFAAGDFESAIERLEEAEQLLGDALLDYPAIPESLGKAYAIRGELGSAIGALEHALEMARARGDVLDELRFCVLLANAEIDSGGFGRAEQLLGHALAASKEATDPILRARLYWSQSRLHAERGEYDTAARQLRRAIALIEMTENHAYVARAHHLLAYIELGRGNAEEALKLLRDAFPLIARGGDRFLEAQFRLEEARALLQLGRLEDAKALALEVLPQLEQMSRIDSARCYTLVADTLAATGDPSQAIALYQASLEKLQGSRNSYAIDVHRKLASLLEAQGRVDEAYALLKHALALQSGHTQRV